MAPVSPGSASAPSASLLGLPVAVVDPVSASMSMTGRARKPGGMSRVMFEKAPASDPYRPKDLLDVFGFDLLLGSDFRTKVLPPTEDGIACRETEGDLRHLILVEMNARQWVCGCFPRLCQLLFSVVQGLPSLCSGCVRRCFSFFSPFSCLNLCLVGRF